MECGFSSFDRLVITCFDGVALVDSDCAGPGLIQDGKTRGIQTFEEKGSWNKKSMNHCEDLEMQRLKMP